MVKITIKIILVFLFLFSATMCNKTKKPLSHFFNEIKAEISEEVLIEDIKQVSQDSLMFFYSFISDEFNKRQEILEFQQEISEFLDSTILGSRRERILFFAFQKYLNGHDIILDKIIQDIERVDERYEIQYKR